MIAKMVKGRGFRGALEYDLTKEKGRVIDSNMAGQNPRELAAEFGEIRKLRPNLGKAVLHVSLSAAPGEKLTDEQWREVGQRYLRGMGFKDNQFVITRHTDTEHEHIHILANRITHAGEVVSDGQDYKRQETIMREIERDYGLQRVAPSIEAERKAPTKGEIEGAIRTGQPSARQLRAHPITAREPGPLRRGAQARQRRGDLLKAVHADDLFDDVDLARDVGARRLSGGEHAPPLCSELTELCDRLSSHVGNCTVKG